MSSRRPKALVGNAADDTQVRRGKETERQREEREANDLGVVLSTVEGRRFLWRVMAKCRTYESVFSTDPGIMAFMAGRQDLGHWLFGMVTETDPRAMLTMMTEAGKVEAAQPDPPPTAPLPDGGE